MQKQGFIYHGFMRYINEYTNKANDYMYEAMKRSYIIHNHKEKTISVHSFLEFIDGESSTKDELATFIPKGAERVTERTLRAFNLSQKEKIQLLIEKITPTDDEIDTVLLGIFNKYEH